MNISNKDIHVKAYFVPGLFDRMEKRRTETGESRSSYVANAVAAWLDYGSNHMPVPAAGNRTKLAPNRRPTPRIHLRQ